MTKEKVIRAAGIVFLALAIIIAISAIVAPKAGAHNGSARVEVEWTGTNCIEMYDAFELPTWGCGGHQSFYNLNVRNGTITGVDPVMGSADYIYCAFYLDGVLKYWDSAYAGDGTDVDCIRQISYGVQNGIYA